MSRWARITIGRPGERDLARAALQKVWGEVFHHEGVKRRLIINLGN